MIELRGFRAGYKGVEKIRIDTLEIVPGEILRPYLRDRPRESSTGYTGRCAGRGKGNAP